MPQRRINADGAVAPRFVINASSTCRGACTNRKIFEVSYCSPDTHLTGAMFVVALLP